MKRTPCFRHFAALLGVVLSAGALIDCGYRIVESRELFGMHRIAVMPFAEKTPSGLSGDLAHALSERLAAGGVHIAAFGRNADATLQGQIDYATTVNSPTPIGGNVAAYQITAGLRAELVNPQGVVLWKTLLASGEDFLASNVPNHAILATEANRLRAMRRLAQTLAARLHEQLLLANVQPTVQEQPALETADETEVKD